MPALGLERKASVKCERKDDEMVIIRMWSGLGNQLFIYGLYEKMRSLGKETYIYRDRRNYASFVKRGNMNISYQLPLLHLNPVEFPEPERIKRYFPSNTWSVRIMRKLDRRVYYEEPAHCGTFDPNILNKDNAFLSGNFQSEMYFEDVGDIIRNKIHFVGSNDNEFSELLSKMREENSVSLQVRLTDYVREKDFFGEIYNSDYYKRSIEKIKEKVSNPVFYLFSDDLETAQKILSEHKIIPVSVNSGMKSYLDMFLMSQCKHHIIANSSFGWWGAWLNSYNDKIVIAPKRWLNTIEAPDICPKSWIRI